MGRDRRVTVRGRAAHALLTSLGVAVVRAEDISPLRSAHARKRCYRVDLADGRTVKLRRSSSAAAARRYADLVAALQDVRLAGVLALRGDLTLEEWITGEAIQDGDVSTAEVEWGGELLRALHATRRIGSTSLPPMVSTRAVRSRLEADLRTVLAMGAIPKRAGARLRAAAARHDPGAATTGVLHTDLCPENLVRGPCGVIRVIDNEGMQIGPTGFDLARVWYRWPMSEARWRRFLAAYRRQLDPAPALAHFPFWQIAAILQSARLRLTRRTAHADLPVQALLTLATRL